MMATVLHVISGLGLRTFQADGLLLTRVYTLLQFLRSHNFKIYMNITVNFKIMYFNA